MTREVDLSRMTSSTEVLPQYGRQTGGRNKDVFNWAIGQSAITEMTKTVRGKEPNSLALYQLNELLRLHIFLDRIKHHSRAGFLNLKGEPGESAAES